LHTQSHREHVMQRFEDALALAVERAERETAPRAAAGGRR
jgi:hypothetical protein